MSNQHVETPPRRWAGFFKALLLLAVGVKIYAHVAPMHPLVAIFGALLVLGSVLLVIVALLNALSQ